MTGSAADLLPLSLGVARLEPGHPPVAHGGGAIEALRAEIWERDSYACRFCGFVARKYQDVVHLSGDPRDLAPERLATACIFCHQTRNLQQVGPMRSGSLVWLPEIPQARLNTLTKAIYIARITSGPMADAARLALDALMSRRDAAKARLGTDDPATLAAVLQDFLEDHEYAQRDGKLDGIRLLPHDRRVVREADLEFNQFPQILAYWRSKDGPFGGMMPPTWFDLFDEVTDQVARRMAGSDGKEAAA